MTDMSTVAKNLRDIEDMALRLEARAIDRSNSHDMPGGDALVNLAPVASPRQWAEQLEYAERHADAALEFLKDAQPDIAHEDPDELWPASEVLTWWSEDYRQRLGMDYEGWKPNLRSEVAFLRNRDVADWIWNNEIHWDDYASDVARAKSKLENILIEGDRSERTPVVCDRCEDKRPLVRVYDDRVATGWACHCGTVVDAAPREHCPNPLCWSVVPPVTAVWSSDTENDRWKCMGCKHQFTVEELDDARATQMRKTDPREWVTRTQAIGLLCSMGHQRRVAARLVDLPEAAGWRDDDARIRWVSWPEVWRSHLLYLQAAKIRLENEAKAKAHKETCEQKHAEDCWIPGRGCSEVCPRGQNCEWFLCPVHAETRASA